MKEREREKERQRVSAKSESCFSLVKFKHFVGKWAEPGINAERYHRLASFLVDVNSDIRTG